MEKYLMHEDESSGGHGTGDPSGGGSGDGERSQPHGSKDSKLDAKLKKQAANYKAFLRTLSNIQVETLTEKWEYDDALKKLETRWMAIDSLHWEVDGELVGRENREFEAMYNDYETRYNTLRKLINTKMWSDSYREKTTPKLEVPTFNGSYNQWVSFKDLFTEAIHNNPSLSKAQKMQFLKGKVRGEAERLIQHLQISSDNYITCWEILNNRYNNKKIIFSTHMNILLDLPNMKHQSMSFIKRMHDVTQECLNAIKNLGVDISTWDPVIVHILDLKLDTETHAEYIDSLKDRRELPILKDFLNFLEGKFTALETSRRKGDYQQKPYNNQHYQPIASQLTSSGKYQFNKGNSKPITKSTFNVTTIKCPLCNTDHGLYNCRQFLELPSDQKLKAVKDLKVCINCLFSHYNNECKSTKTCRKCAKKHNTIMHDSFNKPTSSTSSVTQLTEQNNPSHVSRQQEQNQPNEVLLSTAVIRVKGSDGTYHNLRGLIDQGSQVSIITERAAQQLKIKRQHCKGSIVGVGERENSSKGLITIECHSIHNEYKFQTDVIIMNNLIGNLPNRTFKKPDWTFVENIALADPEFYISRPIDILFGADIYSTIILEGIIKGKDACQPIVQQTKLGWLLCGSAKTYKCNVLLNNLEEMKKFWEIEEISEQSNLSVEDQKCISFYNETTNRKEDGRYEVSLPLKENIEQKLGDSKQTALAQFRNLEKKFQRQPKLASDYKEFMKEYCALNHMRLAHGNETPEYYMPHHGVERIDSLTTQYRVVFNASNKTSTGYSLNDLMSTGPNLQMDLQMLLLKWRQYQYVFTADIEKMFRMILVNTADQKYQQIFWRETSQQPIQTFYLTTVTYGTRAAPFLAMMTLRRLAADEQSRYPEASKVVETAFYMDDLLHGADTIEEGKKLISDLSSLMKSGGFNLRKWSSNNDKLLEDLKHERNKSNDKVFNFKTDNISKTLGLCWNSSKDTFLFQCNIPTHTTNTTKRSLLSEISKLFDPLGWLAPLSTKLKLLFQKVWKVDMRWDEQVSDDINREWSKIKAELNVINQYEIPRWIRCHKNDVIELHGFSDASIEAYACVVYARASGQSKSVLVAAKTKLVPHKKAITLPRLELSGAHLLSKLMKKIIDALKQKHDLEVYGWTDSMVALGWLQGEPSRWKPFVSHRVQHTTDVIPGPSWRYVRSCENPADAASRGLYATQLKENTIWWNGPTWLTTFEKGPLQTETYLTEEELKTKHSNVVQKQKNIVDDLMYKYNSFNKTTRVLAWLLRTFAPAAARKQMPNYLTLHELSAAKMFIVKHVQQNEFRTEIEQLRKHNKVEAKSKLINLNPFIDSCGVLRVGGRLRNANINMEMKHPKIIPRDSRLAEMLINEAHLLTFHGGPRLTQANLRQQYWIPGGNNAVKKQLRNCVTCRKNDPRKQYQLMGDLPAARVVPASPFYHTGVDYTGFVNIKANKMRNARMVKGYVAVFICMVTKAVHLELVSDLTSSAFLAALRRMSARRGAPRHLYSDCGTNFIGANRALQEEYEQVKRTLDDNLPESLTNMNIEWHFNAPSWPSAGGLWERAVRSLKFHLRRVVGDQRLTFEEFSTTLAQLEACLNSRPLCALSENIDDLEYLTPAHFLTGRAGVNVIQTAEDARTRWHLMKQITQQLWKKWSAEYLTQLTARSKWLQPKRNMQVGDLVIIQDDNLQPGKWPMGRVVELHPGRDSYIRVVTLKTENGLIKRPIVKLCRLPINTSESNNSPRAEKQEESNSTKHKNKRTHSTLYTVAMAFLFFMTLISSTSATSNITGINLNQTLYFDPLAKMQLLRDKWTLVAYYDMSPYWEGTTAFEKLLNYLEKTCYTMETHNKCNMIAPQLRHGYTELQYYNQLLLTQHFSEHARQRRGLINGVGYIANSLFGVLDEHFAEQYTKDIQLIKQNEAHLRKLWNKRTSVVESEYNLLKRMEELMDKQHKIINKHLNSLDTAINTLQKEVNDVNREQDFTLSAIIAHGMLQNLKDIQKMMLDTISDIYQGQFNLHLLTPKQLQEELNTISGLLSSDQTLPIDNIHKDFAKIYMLSKIKARMTEHYFIFEIQIPLVSRETYDLYHVIKIPKLSGEKMITITPISKFMAINLQKDSYLSVTQENIQECFRRDSTTYMCDLQDPIFKMKSDKDLCILDTKNNECKTSVAACENKWTSLKKTNTYLYFCCKQCQLRIMCGSRVTARQLTRANIISLKEDCVIKSNDFTIYGHKHYENQIDVAYDIQTAVIAPINHILNITIDTGYEYGETNETELQRMELTKEIEEKIKTLHANNDTYTDDYDFFSYHDIHHYTLIYCIVIGIVLAGVVAMWRRSRRSWRGTPAVVAPVAAACATPRAPPRNVRCDCDNNKNEIELKELKRDPPRFRKLDFTEDSS